MPKLRSKNDTVSLTVEEVGLAVRLFIQHLEESLKEKEDRYQALHGSDLGKNRWVKERIRYYSQIRGHLRELLATELNWGNHLPRVSLILDAIEYGRAKSV